MPASTAVVNGIGFYCGRFGPGVFGEPLNVLSNLAFISGSAFAWSVWRRDPSRSSWESLLFLFAACIGVGSIIFHAEPTPSSLLVDLVPIQVFGLAFGAYVLTRYLSLSALSAVAILVAFALVRQYWVAVAPQGALGGGITHVPALVALAVVAFSLRRKRNSMSGYVAAALGAYVCALLVRSWDLYLCKAFPLGLHWLWHLLTALTATLLLVGVAKVSPNPSIERTA